MKHISTALLFSALAGLSLGAAPMAQAQTATRFSTIEFKDTTLNDALELIFQAANNPAHTIDPSASQVPIGTLKRDNIAWDAALRGIANQFNFKVSRATDGSYLVEPRQPVNTEGEGFPGSSSGFPRGGFPGGNPGNPFGGGGRNGGGMIRGGRGGLFEIVPGTTTRANAQTNPRFGQGTGGANSTDSQDGKIFKVIPVMHVYAGGIAQLFQGAGQAITTQQFVSPGFSSIGGGNGFGGGGFGGGQGGFGGGGFGGGGFGGGGFGGIGGF